MTLPYHCRAHRVANVWADYMHDFKSNPKEKFISVASSMIPSIESAAKNLATLTNMNRTVHTPTYNSVIAEAAQKCPA